MRAVIELTGDILCSPGVTDRFTDKGHIDYTPIFEQIKDRLSDCDLLVGNLETPIAGADMLFTRERYCFNTPVEFAQTLKNAGFGLVTLANNHCMDRGEEGLLRTLDNLDRIGLPHTGLNRDGEKRYIVKNVRGINVAFVNYTYGTNAFAHHIFLKNDLSGRVNLFQPQETLPGSIHLLESMEHIGKETERLYTKPNSDYDRYIKPHLDMLRSDIQNAKKESDFVIFIMHSGGQYNPTPDPYTQMLVSKLREYGADCIVGHHPHVIHGYDVKDGVFCAYSLGNLVCDPADAQDPVGAAHSALLKLSIEKNENKTKLADASFSLIRTVRPEDGRIYCVDCFDKPDNEKKLSLYEASLLTGKAETVLRHEYILDI